MHVKFTFPLIFFLLITTGAINRLPAQDYGTFWTGGFNAGMIGWSPTRLDVINGNTYFQRTGSYGFGEVEDRNGNKHIALLANTSLGLHGGLLWCSKNGKSFTSLELEAQNNKACYEFRSPFIINTGKDSLVNWVETDKYFKYSIAIQRGWYLDESSFLGGSRYVYLRESFGQTLFHRNFSDPIRQDYSEDWRFNGTGFTTKVIAFNPRSWMLATELGLRSTSGDNLHAFDFGIVYYAPFVNTFVEEDEFFKQGNSVGKSRITYNGGELMFNVRYSFNYKKKERLVDSTKFKKEDEPVITAEKKRRRKINNRDLDIQEKIKVESDSVVVEVWDRGKVDGDRISLYLNGDLVVNDITLKKEKQSFVLHLEPGANYLVMEALNLGSIPPNTAAINIVGGMVKKSTRLVSDTGKSGAIEIVCGR